MMLPWFDCQTHLKDTWTEFWNHYVIHEIAESNGKLQHHGRLARWRRWSDERVGEWTVKRKAEPHSPTLTSLHLRHSSFSNPSVASPTVDPGGSVVIILASGSEVRGCDPGRDRWIFSERKNPEYDFLRKGSKSVGPVSAFSRSVSEATLMT